LIGNYTVSYLDDNDCFSISNAFLFGVLEVNNESESVKKLLKITDLLGKEISPNPVIDNVILLYIFDDGSVEKRIAID
jgi:hypothetical protein